MSASRTRARQATRIVNRRADWKQRVVVPFGQVSALMPLPVARRLQHDRQMFMRIARAADYYAEENLL